MVGNIFSYDLEFEAQKLVLISQIFPNPKFKVN
jgi:hypothetical protein